MNKEIPLELAAQLTVKVNEAFASGEMMEQVTPMTAELLRYWFCEPFTNERNINFHEGQRQAILNIIFLHEVLKINNVTEIYKEVVPQLLPLADLSLLSKPKYAFPKYAVKMATGTGKTWVMHALLLWQILNARHTDSMGEEALRYTQRFLIVAPGLVVYDRLQDAFKGRLKEGKATERDPMTNDFRKFESLFIPPAYREEVFGFLQNNVVSKEDGIGRKVTGEIEEVEWQKGLDFIAKDKAKFYQIDFSATPYSTSGTGSRVKKHYFPHIIVDFDLTTAMKRGLVKTLLLDKRQELTDLEHLDFKAVRDERNKVLGLSEGQRLMLRAGLTKLAMLEKGFSHLDTHKCPKMMVICEDTSVTPFVTEFLEGEGLGK